MLFETPERCTLINMNTGARMVCQFNPERLRVEGGAPQYVRQEPIGAQFQVLQYKGNENRRYVVEFYMDAIGTGFDIKAFNAFLEDLAVRQEKAARPATALWVWPHLLEARVVVEEVLPVYEHFAATGLPLVCTTRVKFEQVSSSRGGTL